MCRELLRVADDPKAQSDAPRWAGVSCFGALQGSSGKHRRGEEERAGTAEECKLPAHHTLVLFANQSTLNCQLHGLRIRDLPNRSAEQIAPSYPAVNRGAVEGARLGVSGDGACRVAAAHCVSKLE